MNVEKWWNGQKKGLVISEAQHYPPFEFASVTHQATASNSLLARYRQRAFPATGWLETWFALYATSDCITMHEPY